MSAYHDIRILLEELRQELGIIFEHGLIQSGLQEQALSTMSGKLGESGLARGEQLAGSLVEQMAASRLDPDWQGTQAVADFSALWRYIGFCLHRLEFLEAKAVLAEQESENQEGSLLPGEREGG